jgi:diguanylate cyclase (GGDEF)-like protein
VAVLLAAMVPLVSVLILLKNRHDWTAIKAKLENHLQEKTVHLRLLNQKLKRQSRSDTLTGLANRRYILQRFTGEIKKARRYGTALTIALLDLDQFKQINADFGYILGDQIIHDVARAIRNCIREIDLVGRFSGEAFLIILPNTDLKMTQFPMRRIFDAINALQWEDGQVRVTLSGGLAEYQGQTLAQMTTEAEKCQHEAKAQGGNRFLP